MNASTDDEHDPVSEQDYHDAIPAQMKDHMWAALLHKAGLGPHPGKYSGPEHPGVHEDEITDTDLHRAREGEVSSKKMQAAHRSEDLGPGEFETQQAKQTGALQQLAGTAGQVQAAQAQASKVPMVPPSSPAGAAGVSRPFPAQAGPGAVPTTGRAPQAQPPPPAPGGEEEAPEESE
jgi:hypothetical protein